MFKKNCILRVTCFLSNRATLDLVILDYRDSKDSVPQTFSFCDVYLPDPAGTWWYKSRILVEA